MDDIEWTPAVEEKRRRRFGVAEVVFHLMLPVAALAFGLPLLLGWISYYSGDMDMRDAQLTFLAGTVFTGLGGLELLVWRHRLRRLKATPVPDAAE